MATVKGALALYDGMTGPLKSIHNALNIVLNSFEAVQSASENVVDVTAIQQAREELARAGATWDNIENNIRDADRAQDDFNDNVREGTTAVDGLGNKLKGILATVVSIAGVKSALNWGKENFELANIQRNAENQLKLVLANMGAQDIEIPVATNADEAAASLSACEDAVNQLDGATAKTAVDVAWDAGGLDGNTFENTLALNTNPAELDYSAFANGVDGSTLKNTLALDANGAAAVYDELTRAIDGNTLENTLTLDTGGAATAYNNFVGGVDGTQITIGVQADTTQTVSAFDAIAAKASEIQGRGIYGDEAMLAGAAELATYFSDTEAIISMMDTLANYSMGMSGGGAVDSKAMVDYATGIGKLMTGSYGAMTKKGFEFTDAQKAIIEGSATEAQIVEALGAEYLDMSSDMQAAAAINSVIAEAWDGLYDNMSNTPEGKIIQFNNSLGDLRETLGNRLYPAALKFFDVFTSKFPQIETVLTWFTDGLSALITILTWIATLGLDVATVFAENWSWIGPIIGGVAAALLVYYGAQLAVNTITGISTALLHAHAFAENVKAASTMMATGATFAETAAQYGLNAALYACPIMWIVILVIALIAAFYAAVAAVNKFAGTSVSATGVICGAFMAALAFIGNIFVALWNIAVDVFVLIYNLVASVANFIGNVFTDPVGAVARLFFDLADTVLGVLQTLAGAIDAIFGSDLSGAVQGWRDSLGGWVEDTFGKGEEVMAKMNADDLKLGRFEYGAAYDLGYNFGEGIEDTVSGMFKMPTLDEMGFDDFGNNLEGIYGNTGDTAANTAATADAIEYTDEDLKYLRDIAEREAINRYTTAQITVEQHNENHISKDTDLDGIMEAWTADFAEKLDISGEGV